MFLNLYVAANKCESKLTSDSSQEFDAINYSDIAFKLWNSVMQAELMRYANRLFRMTEEEFENYITQSQNIYTAKITHTVKSYETLRSISLLYGVTISEILEANNINTAQFADMKEIIVPLKRGSNVIIYPDIMTYDTHHGIKVLGKDVDMKLLEGTDGDLGILNEQNTFEQGVKILITTAKGDVPFDEDFGAVPSVGDEYPSDLTNNLIIINALKGLDQDRRIEDITGINAVKENDSIKINIDAIPIHSEDFS